MFFDTLKNVLGINKNETNKFFDNLLANSVDKSKIEYPLPSAMSRLKYSAGQDVKNGFNKLKNGFNTGANAVKQGLSNLTNGENSLFQKITGGPKELGSGLRNRVSDILLGKEKEMPVTVDENGLVRTGATNARQGGIPSFINDFKTGLNDNLNNSFSPANMYPDENKGFAQRLGEGLGTFGRILDKPRVRGLAVAGAIGAMGGSGGEALTYGLGTTANNQALRGADRLYRNSIIEDEKNKLIENLLQSENFQNLKPEEQQDIINAKTQEILNKYNNVRGYINDKTYQNIALNNYRRNNLNSKLAINTIKDKTTKVKLILEGYKNGSLTPTEAQILLAENGITVNDLQTPNAVNMVGIAQQNANANTTRANATEKMTNAIIGDDETSKNIVKVLNAYGVPTTISKKYLPKALELGYTVIE